MNPNGLVSFPYSLQFNLFAHNSLIYNNVVLVWPLSIPSPSYGWYRTDSSYWDDTSNLYVPYWDFVSNLLHDVSGNRNHAITSKVSLDEVSGNGAAVNVQYLKGGVSSTVIWPPGSIPPVFTICSVTRYIVGGRMQKILAARTINWYHGHWNSKRGLAWYDDWNTDFENTVGVSTDWLVMCGKNRGSPTN